MVYLIILLLRGNDGNIVVHFLPVGLCWLIFLFFFFFSKCRLFMNLCCDSLVSVPSVPGTEL